MRSARFTKAGVGVHSGEICSVEICPAPPGQGITFITSNGPIGANVSNIDPAAKRSTDLRHGDARVRTVEHLMAAMAIAGVADADIRVDGPELPILDGSSRPWVDEFLASDAFHGAGVVLKNINAPGRVVEGNSSALIQPLASDEPPEYGVVLRYGGAVLDGQSFVARLDSAELIESVAPARTYALVEDVEMMRAAGLVKGGTMECALVIGEDGPVNPEGARFVDEPARHKVLDLIGDLYLLGYLPRLSIWVSRPGHRLNHALVEELATR